MVCMFDHQCQPLFKCSCVCVCVCVFRRGVILLHKPGVCETIMPDDDQHTLKLMRVRCGDVGQYTCIVSNAYGSDICHTQLILAGM